MWIVKIALDRPYTFIVMALLILLISPLVISRTPTDIFPNVNIPVANGATLDDTHRGPAGRTAGESRHSGG